MKLYILSDLHLEFAAFYPPTIDADLVILAGDIHVKDKGLVWAAASFPNTPVLYVLGNHEYYGRAYPKHLHHLKLKAQQYTSIYILENDVFEMDGVRFLGCTLWTDFRLLGDPVIAGYEAMTKLNDYRKIRVSPDFKKLRPIDTAALHMRSHHWLQQTLKKDDGYQNVVISHHAPSLRSIPYDYQTDRLSAAYASNLEAFIENTSIQLWIHGHIHQSQDYVIGNTRILCNPRGYPMEANPTFRADFTVEI